MGSNHTGKLNDQEIWPGEGVFYGLGCNIKFPTNMTQAPYTLIATGVTTLPQKVRGCDVLPIGARLATTVSKNERVLPLGEDSR